MNHARTAPGLTEPVLLGLVLLGALAARVWVVATHTYILFPDETFQYLEPAHRLVFGSGIVTWEFLDGIRSWLLPGVLAGVMWVVVLVDPAPAAYVTVLRLLCVLASLSVPYVGFRMAARRYGPVAGLFVGLLCAFDIQAIYFAPAIMTEPLATYAALLGIWLGDRGDACAPRRALAAGLLLGLAVALRYQYAPSLALAALVQHGASPRRLALVGAGATGFVLLALGGLDWLTWGAPFQSVWLNYLRNATQGISSAIGTSPWFAYAAQDLAAWGAAAPVLLACVALGALRAPVLGAVALSTIGLHSLVPHKEPRFVFLATACIPMLVGLGLCPLVRRVAFLRRAAMPVPLASAAALGIAGIIALTTYQRATAADAWHRDRGTLQATAAARRVPDVCGLGIGGIGVYRSGGYTYWNRDLPIFYESWADSQSLPGSAFRLRLRNILRGRDVPALSGAAFVAEDNRFNVLIGSPADRLPGFATRACYGRGTPDDPTRCVFVRPGGCR